MANFSTHASGAIWWPNLELMQVEPPLVGEITHVQMLYPGSVVPLAMFSFHAMSVFWFQITRTSYIIVSFFKTVHYLSGMN